MNKLIIALIILVVISVGWFLVNNNLGNSGGLEKEGISFKSISSNDLEIMLENKDFIMIDVHIPEQEHIIGTDYMISYIDIDKIVSVIPDKDSKIVLYCRSGSMSKQAASELVERGYSNVIELNKGMNEWKSGDREVSPKGSII